MAIKEKPAKHFGNSDDGGDGDKVVVIHNSSEAPHDWSDMDSARILRKIDWRLLPILTLAYVLSFLDRANIGNSKLMHLEADLNLSQAEYSWSLSILFISYVLLEIPSNLMLKRMRPSHWLGFITICWGILASCMAANSSAASILIIRFLLGAAEAGFVPGVLYFLTYWYRPTEIAIRMAIFLSAITLAGALGGILAFAIGHMEGVGGLAAWRWLFLLEGIPTLIMGVCLALFLPDGPTQVKWLSPSEQAFWHARIEDCETDEEKENDIIDVHQLSPPPVEPTTALAPDHYYYTSSDPPAAKNAANARPSPPTSDIAAAPRLSNWAAIVAVFLNYRCHLHALIHICTVIPSYSVQFLLSTVIKELGFDSLSAQLLTVPAHFCGAVFMISMAYHSDRVKERGFHITFAAGLGALGFLLVTFVSGRIAKYLMLLIVGMGVNGFLALNTAWVSGNVVEKTQRGVAMAFVVSFGNIGGLAAGQMYRNSEAPQYMTSHLVNTACLLTVATLSMVLKFLLRRENRLLDQQRHQQSAQQEVTTAHMIPKLGEGIDDGLHQLNSTMAHDSFDHPSKYYSFQDPPSSPHLNHQLQQQSSNDNGDTTTPSDLNHRITLLFRQAWSIALAPPPKDFRYPN
ncbi:hypothetical protein H4R33_001799 [Dimargaris cristalligena]|nr:hypothetical protein H4R33_001799 [Dimargaris cristalligena]